MGEEHCYQTAVQVRGGFIFCAEASTRIAEVAAKVRKHRETRVSEEVKSRK